MLSQWIFPIYNFTIYCSLSASLVYREPIVSLSLWYCPCRYYSREDTEDAVKYISGTILDDRPIRVDFDWGFQEGRQWGRGRSGGQVSYCT